MAVPAALSFSAFWAWNSRIALSRDSIDAVMAFFWASVRLTILSILSMYHCAADLPPQTPLPDWPATKPPPLPAFWTGVPGAAFSLAHRLAALAKVIAAANTSSRFIMCLLGGRMCFPGAALFGRRSLVRVELFRFRRWRCRLGQHRHDAPGTARVLRGEGDQRRAGRRVDEGVRVRILDDHDGRNRDAAVQASRCWSNSPGAWAIGEPSLRRGAPAPSATAELGRDTPGWPPPPRQPPRLPAERRAARRRDAAGARPRQARRAPDSAERPGDGRVAPSH